MYGIFRQRVLQDEIAPGLVDQFQLGAGQIHGRRHQRQFGNAGRHDGVGQLGLAHQHVIGGDGARGPRHAQPGRGIALRVDVDHQGGLADRGQGRAQIDGGGGLTDAALLIGDHQDAGFFGGLRSCGDSSLSSRITPEGSVRLGICLTFIFQDLWASVNSDPTFWPLETGKHCSGL